MSESLLNPVPKVEGRGVVVRGNDIDTDRIIPARFMKVVTFAGLEKHAFEDARAEAQREGEVHPFDDPKFAGASVLVVNKNFGCGSSREHAPQALMRWGIQAVVGESFAEIFYGNCVALGVPCVTLPQAEIARLMDLVEAEPPTPVLVDVRSQKVIAGDGRLVLDAQMPVGPRNQFLSGTWDALAVLAEARDATRATYDRLPYTHWKR